MDRLRSDCLLNLWRELYPMPRVGAGRIGWRHGVPLAAVYTALDTGSEVTVSVTDVEPADERPDWHDHCLDLGERLFEEILAKKRVTGRKSGTYTRALTAVEAAAGHPRLVLLGPAGSGKSTFARYLALCLAGESLGSREANLASLEGAGEVEPSGPSPPAWIHGALLPVIVELRSFAQTEAFPTPGQRGSADHLLAYLEASGAEQGDVIGMLESAFRGQDQALLILDGLDQTPAAADSRERLRQVIASFSRRYPRCRMLVTCRPYADEAESPWRLDSEGFVEHSLRPFDAAKRQAFIEGWYAYRLRHRQVGARQARRASAALAREIKASDDLKPLAERPLMLTVMTDLHAAGGGRLPGGRAGLYERSVGLLLDRWNEVCDVLGGESLSEHLGMDVRRLRRALEGLAHEVHRERGTGAGGAAAEITSVELWRALDGKRPESADGNVEERRVMDDLHQRSGILIGESSERYRFPHRGFQEYLAACHLIRTHFPRLLVREVTSDPARWYEVALLAAGKVADAPFMVWALLEALVPEAPEAEVRTEDPRFVAALIAGLAIVENELWREVEAEDAVKLERVRGWLERSLELGALSPADRAAAGRVLAILGDRRRGVGLRGDGMPDIDWVEVPAGSFRMGSAEGAKQAWDLEKPEHDVTLDAFAISRVPVTHAQYQAFVDAGGYRDSHRECWTEAGWKWKGDRQGPDDNLPPGYLLANHPRVKVSWFEADAFSRWLGRELGAAVRLPAEAEWEKAARGTDARLYPWGDDFDAARCKVRAAGIGQPNAAGMFPSGASPYGVLDMSGNVWEWTLSELVDYADRAQGVDAAATSREVENARQAGAARRVFRGGSFWGVARQARCAYRNGMVPRWTNKGLGFRVLLPVPEPR